MDLRSKYIQIWTHLWAQQALYASLGGILYSRVFEDDYYNFRVQIDLRPERREILAHLWTRQEPHMSPQKYNLAYVF